MNPMQTAGPIATVRAAEGRLPKDEQLFVDPYARLFDDGISPVTEIFLRLPFFVEHVRLRTRYIDDFIRRELEAGVRQIVLVGAGFDCRGLRMPEIAAAGARIVEVDQSPQLDEKRQRLAAAGVSIPAWVVHAPADLSVPGELERAVSTAGVAGARAAWICEGLLGYLGRDDLRLLAEVTARLAGSGSSLIGNHSVSSWSSGTLADIFSRPGWRTSVGPEFDALYRTYIGPNPPPGGEAFAFLEAVRSKLEN